MSGYGYQRPETTIGLRATWDPLADPVVTDRFGSRWQGEPVSVDASEASIGLDVPDGVVVLPLVSASQIGGVVAARYDASTRTIRVYASTRCAFVLVVHLFWNQVQ